MSAPLWDREELSQRERETLRKLEAHIKYASSSRVYFGIRFGSTVSVMLASDHVSFRRGRDILTDPRDGRELRLVRHRTGGARPMLSRAECAALRRAAEPYLEAGREEAAQRWAARKANWAQWLADEEARQARERAERQEENRRRIDAMSPGEQWEYYRAQRREIDRILGRVA